MKDKWKRKKYRGKLVRNNRFFSDLGRHELRTNFTDDRLWLWKTPFCDRTWVRPETEWWTRKLHENFFGLAQFQWLSENSLFFMWADDEDSLRPFLRRLWFDQHNQLHFTLFFKNFETEKVTVVFAGCCKLLDKVPYSFPTPCLEKTLVCLDKKDQKGVPPDEICTYVEPAQTYYNPRAG